MTLVVKADGSTEAFDFEKLKRSLRRSGASESEAREITAHVEAEIHEGMHTEEIYRHAFEELRAVEEPAVVARYALRRALFGLGPTGFPFEDFLARLFEYEGYTARTGISVRGKCALHELDVAAYKPDHAFVVEAKFHAHPGIKSDLQVALYCYARILDLREQKICGEDTCGVKDLWIITNTKFTTAAIEYASCVGLNLLGWDFPLKNNLYDRIQATKLYPITVLQSLSEADKALLLEKKIIVCGDIVKKPQILRHIKATTKKAEAIISEARQLS